MAGRRRGSNGMLLVLALQAASQYAQLERKPPVTAGLILGNVLVYLRPGSLDEILPSLRQVCLNPYLVLRDWDLKRLFLSAFYHVDETHLVYNMLSLLWKGVQLERGMGSRKFATMVAVLVGMSHGLTVVLGVLMSVFTDTPISECAVGFSSVLFALKVVLSHNSPDYSVVYGVAVPSRYAAWAELVLIQMFVPGTSFLGHLSGILAGLLYLHGTRLFSPRRSGGFFSFLSRCVTRSWVVLSAPFRFFTGRSTGRGRQQQYGRGYVGSSSSAGENYRVWRCTACTYDNWEPSVACEMCGYPRSGGSSSSTSPSAPPWPQHEPLPGSSRPSVEELRRARVARFSR